MRALTLCIVTCLFICGCTFSGAVKNPGPEISIDDVAATLADSLSEVWDAADANGVPLSKATITLSTAATRSSTGGLVLLTLGASKKREMADSSSFKVVLTQKPDTSRATGATEDEFAKALLQIIQSANKYSVGGLSASEITATLSFNVKKTTSGGATGYEILPVKVTLLGESVGSTGHSVELVFSRK